MFVCALFTVLLAQPADIITGPNISPPVPASVLDGDLRQLPKAPPWREGQPYREVEDGFSAPDAVAREGAGPALAATVSPVSFDGLRATGFVPPDTVGDIGPNHYIQAVNGAFAIYDRAGNTLVGPSPIKALFTASGGGPCETGEDRFMGDPIVRYDALADRWLVSQFMISEKLECIAVSRTPDPVAGGWFRYAFATVGKPDFPKIAVWPNAYFMATMRGQTTGTDVYAFDRLNMLAGLPARSVQFFIGPPTLFLEPSDLDGPSPPTGTPNFFVRMVDGDQFGGVDRLEVFAFRVSFRLPSGTFTPVATLPVAPFDTTLCGDHFRGVCVPQPGTPQKLETSPGVLSWRLQYRNFGTHEALIASHTVNMGADLAGIRWYELRRTGEGPWSIFQHGDFAPDTTTHRWMAAIAANRHGCIALGYSAASSTLFPSIRFTGRLPTDPPGTMPIGERTLVAGAGSQTGSERWGNYTTLDVDPTDDRTFWYVSEYYSTSSDSAWRTRISSFTLPDCPRPTIEPPVVFKHQVSMLIGGFLTDDALPVNAGFDTAFNYRRHRFLPNWSWELETGVTLTDDGFADALLANGEFHILRHFNAPPANVRPFALAAVGVSHFDTIGFSDSAPLLSLGIGSDFEWTPKIGFRADLRMVWLHDMIAPGWTTNWQILWGPTFSF